MEDFSKMGAQEFGDYTGFPQLRRREDKGPVIRVQSITLDEFRGRWYGENRAERMAA